MTLEANHFNILGGHEHHEHQQEPAGDCVDCDERPATHGERCLGCYESAVLQQTLHIFQRHLEGLEQGPAPWSHDPDDDCHDDDDDHHLCADCGLRKAERERRCGACFENFVTAEAIECIARRREGTALGIMGF